MLKLQNISKSYTQEIKVLDDISIEFPDRGMIGILGKSGCGKSTLLNMIGFLDHDYKGEITFNDKKIDDDYLKSEVSFVLQNHDFISALNVKENIILSSIIAEKKYSMKKLKQIVKKLDIERYLNEYPLSLSYGQQRRIAIARAILKNSAIILADEPTGALHQKQAIEVMKLLFECSKDRLVIIVSHDEKLLQKYCDFLLTLENGKLYGKIKQTASIDKQEIKREKSSLLFYVIKQILKQRYKLFFLFIFQIIMIAASFLMITGMQGIEDEIVYSDEHAPLKNVMTIENYNNDLFEALPNIENAYVDFESILDLGVLSQDVEIRYLPYDTSHIELKEGRFPDNHFDVLVSEALEDSMKDKKITYSYEDSIFELNVVGVIKGDFFKEECLYFPYDFRYEISDFINQQVVVVESKDSLMYDRLSNDYLVSSEVHERNESYSQLVDIGKIVIFIFFAISVICSFILLYIVYSVILMDRIYDSALLLSMGISKKRLFLLFIYEAVLFGIFIAIGGCLLSMLCYYYLNAVYNIKNTYLFSLSLHKYIFSYLDIFIFIIVFYVLLSVFSSFIPIRKLLKNDIISILREE